MTQHFTSLVGSQASKRGALGNPMGKRLGDNTGVDNRFYLGRAPLKSSTCTCDQLLSFHGRNLKMYALPSLLRIITWTSLSHLMKLKIHTVQIGHQFGALYVKFLFKCLNLNHLESSFYGGLANILKCPLM